MIKLYATIAIIMALIILQMVVAGQAKISILILFIAMIASVITMLHSLIIARINNRSLVTQHNWSLSHNQR